MNVVLAPNNGKVHDIFPYMGPVVQKLYWPKGTETFLVFAGFV
jgi:hypothetical protein